MSTVVDGAAPRTIVVPRPLAAHFSERLMRFYETRPGVEIVVDRRVGERRHTSAPLHGVRERRRVERRQIQGTWSLPEMPVHLPDAPV